ncbi:hypothetical protein GGI07_001534 [Coemansia sp. Benny D115]|nr:hypothetical protein GGI07_001534 [Coemansia sp. Benny D115]
MKQPTASTSPDITSYDYTRPGPVRFPYFDQVCGAARRLQPAAQHTDHSVLTLTSLFFKLIEDHGIRVKDSYGGTIGKELEFSRCLYEFKRLVYAAQDLPESLSSADSSEALGVLLIHIMCGSVKEYPDYIRMVHRPDGYLDKSFQVREGAWKVLEERQQGAVAAGVGAPKFLPKLSHVEHMCPLFGDANDAILVGQIDKMIRESLPTPANTREVDSLMNLLRGRAAHVLRMYDVELTLFGSRVHGLCSSNSDLDISVSPRGFFPSTAQEQLVLFHAVAAMLRATPGINNVIKIARTRVPIIKFTYLSVSGACLEGDISINNEIGIAKTNLISKYMRLDPRVCRVLFVLKEWGVRRNITHYSVLNSYSLLMMGITFLISEQVIPPLQLLSTLDIDEDGWQKLSSIAEDPQLVSSMYPRRRLGAGRPGYRASAANSDGIKCLQTGRALPDDAIGNSRAYFYSGGSAHAWKSPNTDSVPVLIFEMFRFYGCEFDPLRCAISPRLGTAQIRRAYLTQLKAENPMPYLHDRRTWAKSLRLLAIEDPFELKLNCGRNAGPEWVEGFLWEMRRAAHAMLPQNKGTGLDSILPRILLRPTENIYGSPAVWFTGLKWLEHTLHSSLGRAWVDKMAPGPNSSLPELDLERLEVDLILDEREQRQ